MLRSHMIMLRRAYGEDAATATKVRSILAPVANQLSCSGDTSVLHRRLVLFQLRVWKSPEDVRAAFDGVEAVAICVFPTEAVVVFETDAGAARAVQGAAKEAIGSCKAVPSLDLAAPPYHFIPYKMIKVSGPAGASRVPPPPPEPSKEDRARAFQEMCERTPMIEYAGPAEWVACRAGMTRTKRFTPSAHSLVYGPRLGRDGHLWMDGTMVTYCHAEGGVPGGSQHDDVSIRVKQEETDATKIRFTALEPVVYFDNFGHLYTTAGFTTVASM